MPKEDIKPLQNDIEDQYDTTQKSTDHQFKRKTLYNTGSTAILFCHGFTATPQSLEQISNYLCDNLNCTVSIPLLPDHGLPNWRNANQHTYQDWINHLSNELIYLKKTHKHVFVVGQSMGGNLAMQLSAKHSKDIAGTVLLNPLADTPSPGMSFARILKTILGNKLGIPTTWSHDNEIKYKTIALHLVEQLNNLYQATQKIIKNITVPVLLLTSTNDKIVPHNSREFIRKHISSSNFQHHNYNRDDINHVISMADADIGQTISTWIKRQRTFNRRNKRYSSPIFHIMNMTSNEGTKQLISKDNNFNYNKELQLNFPEEYKNIIENFIKEIESKDLKVNLKYNENENIKEYELLDRNDSLILQSHNNEVLKVNFPYIIKFATTIKHVLQKYHVSEKEIQRIFFDKFCQSIIFQPLNENLLRNSIEILRKDITRCKKNYQSKNPEAINRGEIKIFNDEIIFNQITIKLIRFINRLALTLILKINKYSKKEIERRKTMNNNSIKTRAEYFNKNIEKWNPEECIKALENNNNILLQDYKDLTSKYQNRKKNLKLSIYRYEEDKTLQHTIMDIPHKTWGIGSITDPTRKEYKQDIEYNIFGDKKETVFQVSNTQNLIGNNSRTLDNPSQIQRKSSIKRNLISIHKVIKSKLAPAIHQLNYSRSTYNKERSPITLEFNSKNLYSNIGNKSYKIITQAYKNKRLFDTTIYRSAVIYYKGITNNIIQETYTVEINKPRFFGKRKIDINYQTYSTNNTIDAIAEETNKKADFLQNNRVTTNLVDMAEYGVQAANALLTLGGSAIIEPVWEYGSRFINFTGNLISRRGTRSEETKKCTEEERSQQRNIRALAAERRREQNVTNDDLRSIHNVAHTAQAAQELLDRTNVSDSNSRSNQISHHGENRDIDRPSICHIM